MKKKSELGVYKTLPLFGGDKVDKHTNVKLPDIQAVEDARQWIIEHKL